MSGNSFDIARALEPDPDDELRQPLNFGDTVFDACLILEARIREFETERAKQPPTSLFDHSEGEIKLNNALAWLSLEIPDEAWIVKL